MGEDNNNFAENRVSKPLMNKRKTIWRIIAVIGLIGFSADLSIPFLLPDLCTQAAKMYIQNTEFFFPTQFLCAADVAGIGIFLYLCFSPLTFELYGLYSLFVAVINLLNFHCTPWGMMMYVLAFITFSLRGYLHTHTKIKITAAGIVFLLLISTGLRCGKKIFFIEVFSLAEYTALLFVILLFVYEKIRMEKSTKKDRILDLTEFPELTERDREWTKLALTQIKYDTIASHYGMTTGSVKNRMKRIFTVLDVPDRIGLMAKYSSYEVITTEEELAAWKERFLHRTPAERISAR
jgi:hypothetical protein